MPTLPRLRGAQPGQREKPARRRRENVRRGAHNPATTGNALARRYVARTRRNRQSRTGQRRITRGPLPCIHGLTCTDSTTDGARNADHTGISWPPFHDSFHGQQPIAARHRHYNAYLGQLLSGTEADRRRWVMSHTTCCLCRLGRSLAGAVTSADRTDHISLRRLRLPRLGLSRRVRFTNRFTEQAIDLRFPHPPALPWLPSLRHRVGLAKRLPSGTASTRDASPPSRARRRAAPRPCHHRCRVCTWAPPAAVLSRPLPRTRLLPDLTADGFCPGSAQPITQ